MYKCSWTTLKQNLAKHSFYHPALPRKILIFFIAMKMVCQSCCRRENLWVKSQLRILGKKGPLPTIRYLFFTLLVEFNSFRKNIYLDCFSIKQFDFFEKTKREAPPFLPFFSHFIHCFWKNVRDIFFWMNFYSSRKYVFLVYEETWFFWKMKKKL